MSKWKVKGVSMNRKTRKQVGDIRVEQIDTKTNSLFIDSKTAINIEKRYESFWNDLNPKSKEIVKVINVEKVN